VKNKETYAVAKSLLEKYGETITPEIRSPVMNGNSKSIDLRQRTSMKPAVTSPLENGNHPIQTPVRGGTTRLAGRYLFLNRHLIELFSWCYTGEVTSSYITSSTYFLGCYA